MVDLGREDGPIGVERLTEPLRQIVQHPERLPPPLGHPSQDLLRPIRGIPRRDDPVAEGVGCGVEERALRGHGGRFDWGREEAVFPIPSYRTVAPTTSVRPPRHR